MSKFKIYFKKIKKIIHIYKYLFELIKQSKNLKSLTLRVQSIYFNDDIYFIFSLIEDLKKLRIINITQYLSNTQFNISLETLFNKFPKLKNRIHYFEEFKINNEGFERKINNIEIKRKYINKIHIEKNKKDEENKKVMIQKLR